MGYLGSIRLLGDYPGVKGVEQNPPQNDLQTAWNEGAKHYEKKTGVIEVDGKPYEFKVSFIELGEQRRAITEVAPDLNKRHDIVIPILPGFGETSAQFEGDFLNLVLEVSQEAGFQNPKVLGLNTLGKGTPEYVEAESRGRISAIGLMDELTDVADIAEVLAGHGHFGNRGQKPSVAVIGHSMGALNASSFMNVLNQGGDHKVDRLLNMMPAVDGPFAMMRAKFLWAVRKQVVESVKQAVPGRGSLSLNEQDYHRIMFGDEDFRDPEQYARSVPDSARRFLQLTLNLRRRFADVYKVGGSADGVKMTVWQGGKDKLIPDNAIDDLFFLVEDNGLEQGVNVRILPELSHSIPFRLRGEQRDQVKAALESFFN